LPKLFTLNASSSPVRQFFLRRAITDHMDRKAAPPIGQDPDFFYRLTSRPKPYFTKAFLHQNSPNDSNVTNKGPHQSDIPANSPASTGDA
jgi:hypothetical protein